MKLTYLWFCCLGFYFGFVPNSIASDMKSWNFLGTFIVRGNDGKTMWEKSYPVQKDSFSVPSDWMPGDEFDWYYMLANISPGARRSLRSDRVIRGVTATHHGDILTLYSFEILLKHPLVFSRAKGEFSRIEEIHYTSRRVKVDELKKALGPVRFYFDVPRKEFSLNYENRSEGSLCVDRSKIPEDYFPQKKINLNPFLATHDMDDLNPAPILKGNLGFKIPPLPSCAESKGKLPKDFWEIHRENLRKAYAGDDSFGRIQFGFHLIECDFSDPEGGIHSLFGHGIAFNPKTSSLEFCLYFPERDDEEKSLKGAVFALKALVDYWQKNNYEDYRVECLAYWIEEHEARQKERAKE